MKISVRTLRLAGFGVQPQDRVFFTWDGPVVTGGIYIPSLSLLLTCLDEGSPGKAKGNDKKSESRG